MALSACGISVIRRPVKMSAKSATCSHRVSLTWCSGPELEGSHLELFQRLELFGQRFRGAHAECVATKLNLFDVRSQRFQRIEVRLNCRCIVEL